MPSVLVTVALLIAAVLAGPSPADAGPLSVRPSRARAAELAAESHALRLYPLAAAAEFERLCGRQLDPPSTREDRSGIALRRTEVLEAAEVERRRHAGFDRQAYRQALSTALEEQRQAAAKLVGDIVAAGGCRDARLRTVEESFRLHASPAMRDASRPSAPATGEPDPSVRPATAGRPSRPTPLGGTNPPLP